MPIGPETQLRSAFAKIATILAKANLTLDLFAEPYPAWTAIEAAGLRREGALVEIRVIASTKA